ncbi:irregular chiasm C-roughest protein [Eurytemora carolleeae]|uniref:irregular chiasm C-roughest protein n=1 Tax=Eurytemora carolleeae TaxID=1294199 RepID=UPI000C79064F|nr:irregular chiasm C-roughest protein [Eurytemora carolleeae]XP_023330825.1 irregular chiasm C-roughest protein [Eurytemora carolleeae]|eukprot:XP_023330824.1 irregular chiasm C-roughest protein-like [Eurytemora affinis]
MLLKLVLLYLFLGLCQSRQEVVGGDFPSQGVIYPLKGSTNNLYKGEVYSDLHLQENHQLQVQRFLREPPDQTAKIGEQVTLPCRVENKKGKLQWTRDDFGLGQGRDLTGFDRYEMTGSDQEGDYTLNIFPVQLEDNAVFQCQVGAARGIAPIRSRYATLTVTVPPEPPVILNGEVLKVTEDRLITVECVSKAGKPAAEITWLDSDNIPIHLDVETIVEVLEDGKRQNTISLLRRKARRSDNIRNLTCEAQNSAESIPSRATIQIHVEYAPHVTLQYQPHKLQDGETVTFKCSADANPSDVTYKWYLNNQILDGKTSKTLTLSPLNRTLHAAILKCAARNKIGRSEETHTLEVMYGPSWVVEPTDQAGQEREQVQLICLADSNPNPRYSWFKDGDFDNIISSSSNLTVYLNLQAQGRYTCRVSVKGFSGLERSAQVLIKGKYLRNFLSPNFSSKSD